jgi:hypothetical protein
MEPESQTKLTKINLESSESPVTITIRQRSVDMFHIFDYELDSIGSASQQSSIHLAFFGASIGAAIALWITIATVEIKNPNISAAFWGTALASTLSTLYFAIKSKQDYKLAKQQIAKIKANPNREA